MPAASLSIPFRFVPIGTCTGVRFRGMFFATKKKQYKAYILIITE